ncbi:MAG: TraB/GumN family protein [Sphingomonadales bacterium]|nr:TraB/GumN family protein [Sphingomonadaceae bacterium]MBS3931352.1 TraB/GumN family protein [Sphingomonadales bacterium]
MFSKGLTRLLLALLGALALSSCARPAEVRPALWLVEGPGGQKAWLFGTIHALAEPVDWRSATVAQALAQSDRLVLEVAAIENDQATASAFANLASSPGLPPVEQRLPPDLRDELAGALKAGGIKPGSLDGYESWAVALMLQQAASRASKSNSGNGIDRALASSWRGPIDEFEGAAAQLGVFDRLPENAQRALLVASLEGQADHAAESRLARAWAEADLALIERETDGQLAREPVLREALLVGRNRAWTERLTTMLKAGGRPFVAVGTAHLVGKDGLPAMLEARGYKVTRLQ